MYLYASDESFNPTYTDGKERMKIKSILNDFLKPFILNKIFYILVD